MSDYEQILQTYAAMSMKSALMVEAAKSSDWDRLIALEKDCSAMIEQLKKADTGAPRPDAGYLRRKVALIRKVLADDAEIRSHTEAWMQKLQVLFGSARQEQRLLQAYDNGGG